MRSPQEAAAPELLAVGVITHTHGVTGELKVKSLSGEAAHLLGLREVLLRKGAVEKRASFVRVRAQGTGLIVQVAGLEAPETARALVGFEIWVPRSQAAPLSSGEYYEADLCGCTVWVGEREVGRVRSVWEGGPMQLLEVERGQGKAFLVPFSGHFVADVDVRTRRIRLTGDELLA